MAILEEVIRTDITRGRGSSSDPFRTVSQVFTKEGVLIAENDTVAPIQNEDGSWGTPPVLVQFPTPDQGWRIYCEEQPAFRGFGYLVYGDSAISTAVWIEEGHHFMCHGNSVRVVTHWMPLPTLPSE